MNNLKSFSNLKSYINIIQTYLIKAKGASVLRRLRLLKINELPNYLLENLVISGIINIRVHLLPGEDFG